VQHLDEFFPSRNSYFSVEGALSKLWKPSVDLRTNIDYYGMPLAVLQNHGTRGGMELFAYQLAKLQRVVSIGVSTAGQLGSYVLDTSSNEFIYQSDAGSTIDNIEFEATGVSPEQIEAFGLNQSSATDPQFEAAFMTLMGII
jgi:C-terminal processing protease CtpA/Prc